MSRHTHNLGYHRARTIRTLHAERCNVHEIATFLAVPEAEVRRTIARPVPGLLLESARNAARISADLRRRA